VKSYQRHCSRKEKRIGTGPKEKELQYSMDSSLCWLKNENVREIITRPVDVAVHDTSHAL
jgi:hypothetical protein